MSYATNTSTIENKRRIFERIRKRFEACEATDAASINLRLIERKWTPKDSEQNLLHDFSEIDAATGWNLIEQCDSSHSSGQCRQVILFVLDRDLKGDNRRTFERWVSVAELAGNELDRNAILAGHLVPLRNALRWVWMMKELTTRGVISLPLRTQNVDMGLWLRWCQAENERNGDAEGLRDAVERHGMETLCTDSVSASILLADWLATNDWPFDTTDNTSKVADADDANGAPASVGRLPVIEGDDAKDYKLFSAIKAEHLPVDFPVSDKRLTKFLDQADDIRQGNPPGKGGKAYTQRRLVHVGDFVRHLPELSQWLAAQGGTATDASEVEARTEVIRKQKRAKK